MQVSLDFAIQFLFKPSAGFHVGDSLKMAFERVSFLLKQKSISKKGLGRLPFSQMAHRGKIQRSAVA